jgi:quercetin dioxygenase-like cupin family protein
MGEVVLIPPGDGEVIGDSADRRVEILSDDETLNATSSRFGPHREGADLHVHRHHTDCFYVLDGELTVRLGLEDDVVTVPAGTLARVPPHVVHGFRNASDAEVRYLNLHAPGQRFADYLRATRDGRSFSYDQYEPPEDGGRPASEAVVGGTEHVAERPGLHVELLADVDELGLSENRCEPAAETDPRHVHRRHVESLYILDGELTVTLDEGELTATMGTWVQIPAGVAHGYACTGDAVARLLEIHTPGSGYGASLRALAGFDQDLV